MAIAASSSPFASSTSKRFQTGKLRSLAWNADGRRLATGGADKTLRVWVPEKDNRTNSQMTGHTGEVSSVRWDPAHPELLASCSASTGSSADKGVYLWDIRQGKPTGVIPTSGQNIHMTWSPDGSTIVVSNRSDDVSYIDVKTQSVIKTFRPRHERNEAVFSHGGELLLTALDGYVQISRWSTEEEVARVQVSPVATIVLDLDPRGRYLAAGSNDAMVTLWDTQEWNCVASAGHHDDPIRTAKFSHDGQYLASSSGDGNLVISQVPTLEKVHSIVVPGGGDTCSWHPTKLMLAYAADESDSIRTPVGGFRVWGA